MVAIQQRLAEDGVMVSMVRLYHGFGQPRQTVYYKPAKALQEVRPELAEPIKALIE